jgi:5'-3' exonuclease
MAAVREQEAPGTAPALLAAQEPAEGRAPVIMAVDAPGLLMRCIRAGEKTGLHTKDYVPTGPLAMFVSSLARKLRLVRPDTLILAWDGLDARLWREGFYPGYKSNRLPPHAGSQHWLLADQFCDAAQIPQMTVRGFEADDLLAAVARAAEFYRPEARLLLCSDDRDLQQLLVPGRAYLMSLDAGDRITEAEGVRATWGVEPRHLSWVRALSGDSSDGIPGLPGIGPKTALKMLAYGREAPGWPPDEDMVGDRYARAQVIAWQRIIDLISPPRRPEDDPDAGEEYFSRAVSRRWETPHSGVLAEVRKLFVRYELSALLSRLDEGRLW